MDWNNLNSIAGKIARLSLKSIAAAGSGHPGGCLSVAHILAVLFFEVMQPQPGYSPAAPNADKIILSKGHAAPALYSALHLLGMLSEDELMNLRRLGSRTQGHPARRWLSAVETSTGSLGQGVAYGVGLALSFKRQGNQRRVYVVAGDGDLQEGITTEAARLAAFWQLDNLVIICDKNSKTSDQHSIEPVKNPMQEFKALGWASAAVDGHNTSELVGVLEDSKKLSNIPMFVNANTVKGYGVKFMEDDPAGYHGSLALSEDELRRSLKELTNAQ